MLSSHIPRTAYVPISFSNPGTQHVKVSVLPLFVQVVARNGEPTHRKTKLRTSEYDRSHGDSNSRESHQRIAAFNSGTEYCLGQTRASFQYRAHRERVKGHLESCVKLFRCKSCKGVHVPLSVRFQKRLENLVSHRRELGCVEIWDVFLERWRKLVTGNTYARRVEISTRGQAGGAVRL